jgi:hypothetical protein
MPRITEKGYGKGRRAPNKGRKLPAEVDPGKVFDLEPPLDEAATGYRVAGATAGASQAPAPMPRCGTQAAAIR